jgi:arylformamidase
MTNSAQFDRRTVLRGTVALGTAASVMSAGSALAATAAHLPAMPFPNLPPQGPINAVADVYADCALAMSRLAALTTRCKLGVPYGDDTAQKLDIYLPQQENLAGLPVFINIHGGGWVFGYKEWLGLNAPPIVTLPAVYVAIDYRLGPSHKHPTQIQDCLQALAWVHSNISSYGGSADRIFVGGHSAGAHLSALLTLRTELYSSVGLPAGVIKACFPYNGVYDFRDVTDYGDTEENNVGKPFITDAAAAADASPIAFTKGNQTPFFITWAENDITLIKAQSAAFIMALKGQPGRVEKHMFPKFDHFWTHLDQHRPENPWTRTLIAWMKGDPKTAAVGPFPAAT